MYLRECLMENVGPVGLVDVSLPFNEDGTPKPLVLVGQNGSGKSIFLSYVADALIEFAKLAYQDVLEGQQGENSPYFKIVSPSSQRAGTDFGIGLLQFSDRNTTCVYVEKTGTLKPADYAGKMRGRFASVASWPTEGNHKDVLGNSSYSEREESFRSFFEGSSVCYFPPARHERPHWLNSRSVSDQPIFYVAENYADRLYKPIVVQSAAQENKQWLLDVMLDSLVDVEVRNLGTGAEPQLVVTTDIEDHMVLRTSRVNVEAVLRQVLQDGSAELLLNPRTVSTHRVSIVRDSKPEIPSLDHLSSGQANLFNMFATIIRYTDRSDLVKGHRLDEIEGVILIDEVEAHAHSDLQYETLPRLLTLFPKVQFIMTSHSPLFLLGMEREYGSEGFEIIDMPGGDPITTERFSEFQRSWEYYRRTKTYEEELGRDLAASSKPLVLTEGETDPLYIRTALELLGRQDLLQGLDIEWVGTRGPQGSRNTGKPGLDHTRNVLEANPNLTKRKVLLLYDCDTNKTPEDIGSLAIRTIPRNESNGKATAGIENLLPPKLFEDRFYMPKRSKGNYGEITITHKFQKSAFCKWVCEESRNPDDFEHFSVVVGLLEGFLGVESRTAHDTGDQSSNSNHKP
jgi:hypothetical protein